MADDTGATGGIPGSIFSTLGYTGMGCSRGTVGEYLSSTEPPGLAGSMGRRQEKSVSFSVKPHSGDDEEMMVSGVSLGTGRTLSRNS